MANHDYVIDNQSAPAFRTDLNNALSAIVSNNSGATAPATTYANMTWYDTATNQIKKRNEANSAWIVLGTIDETAGTFTVSGVPDIATQLEAEEGTDNTVLMTPLRTKQAIDNAAVEAGLLGSSGLDMTVITALVATTGLGDIATLLVNAHWYASPSGGDARTSALEYRLSSNNGSTYGSWTTFLSVTSTASITVYDSHTGTITLGPTYNAIEFRGGSGGSGSFFALGIKGVTP